MKQQNNRKQDEQKPVGYGSSIQSSGHGNRNRPQKSEEVNQELNKNINSAEKNSEKKQ